MKKGNRKFFGWQVLAALWVVVLVNMGFTSYGAGVINALMAKDLNLDRAVLGLGFTMYLLFMGFAAPLVAWLIKRFGARMTICTGSLIVALAALVLAHATTQSWHFIFAYAVMGLGSGLGSSTSAQACITQWFEKKRALAISIILAASGVGGFIGAPLINKIITAGGSWRTGWDFVAVLALIAWLVSLLFVKNRPVDHGQQVDGGRTDVVAGAGHSAFAKPAAIHRSASDWPVKEAVRTRAFWSIALGAICATASCAVVITHGILHLHDIGNSLETASLALGLVALSSIFGKIGAGILCDRFEPRYVWFLALLLLAAGVFVAIDAKSSAAIHFFVICFGVGYGASLVCWASMLANYFGAGAFAPMLGVQFPIANTISSLAPFLVGFAYDLQSNYQYAFTAIVAVSLVASVMLLLARVPTPRAQDVRSSLVQTSKPCESLFNYCRVLYRLKRFLPNV